MCNIHNVLIIRCITNDCKPLYIYVQNVYNEMMYTSINNWNLKLARDNYLRDAVFDEWCCCTMNRDVSGGELQVDEAEACVLDFKRLKAMAILLAVRDATAAESVGELAIRSSDSIPSSPFRLSFNTELRRHPRDGDLICTWAIGDVGVAVGVLMGVLMGVLVGVDVGVTVGVLLPIELESAISSLFNGTSSLVNAESVSETASPGSISQVTADLDVVVD